MLTQLLALALTAPSALGSLADVTYCDRADEARVRLLFDPADWVDGQPRAIVFQTPGRLLLLLGQETETCTFTSREHGHRAALSLVCGAAHRRASWEQTGPEAAVTTLLPSGRGPTFIRLCAYPDLEALTKQFEEDYAARHRSRLTGHWRAADRAELEVGADGLAALDGTQLPALVRRCSAPDPAPCLVWKVATGDGGPAPSAVLALVLGGTPLAPVLREGQLSTDVGYFPVEFPDGGRVFNRQTVP